MSEYVLHVCEGPGGRLEVVSGLPADREERLSVCWRLSDTLRVLEHADKPGLGDGQAWQKYAKQAFVAGWLHDG